MYLYLFYLLAMVAPLPLLVIENVVSYPVFIEELYKMIALVFAQNKKILPKLGGYGKCLIFGFIFGFSESLLYLVNIYNLGSISFFWARIPTAVFMHVSTTLMLRYFQNRKLIILGFALAITIHYLYNFLVGYYPAT